MSLALLPVRYDAAEDWLVNDFSSQNRILKRRYWRIAFAFLLSDQIQKFSWFLFRYLIFFDKYVSTGIF